MASNIYRPMHNRNDSIISFSLTILTFGFSFIASIVSITVCLNMIYYCLGNPKNMHEKIALMLSLYIYILIGILMINVLSTNIQTILGDLYGIHFYSRWCLFRGYLLSACVCALYNAFVLQAFFRLCRIVYYKWKKMNLFYLYATAAPIQILLAFLIMSPLLIWNSEKYLFYEHYCFISFGDYRSVIWSAFTTYGIPVTLLFLIYFRITIYIRSQTRVQRLLIKRRERLDLIAMRCIFATVFLLLAMGVPAIVFVVVYACNRDEHPLMYRIIWLFFSMSIAGLALAMILTTPELKRTIINRESSDSNGNQRRFREDNR